MALIDTLKNFGSNVLSKTKEFLGLGGGKASSMEFYAPFGISRENPPTAEQQTLLRNFPELSAPPPKAGQGLQIFGYPSKENPQGTYQFIPQEKIRPLITPTIPLEPPSTYRPQQGAGVYRSPEQEAARAAKIVGEGQGKSGNPGLTWNPGGGTSVREGFNPTTGLSGLAGFSGGTANASLGGGVGGPDVVGVGESQEEKDKKKQPNFTMISAQQAQDAARQGLLRGTGQSGVFADQEGNFYGISNAQVANIFGTPDPVTGRIDVTKQNLANQPFRSSLDTGPITAKGLLEGGKEKLLPADQELQNNLQVKIDTVLANQPPTPPVFAMDTQAQAEYRANQSVSGQQYYDQLYSELGIPAKNAELVQRKKELEALEAGMQAIIKDIEDNPDLPKGLAARRIENFTKNNAINIKNLQTKIQFLQDEKDELDKRLNTKLGIFEKDLTREENRQERAKNDAQQNLNTLISSGALASASDSDLQTYAKQAGFTLSSLKSIRDNLVKKQNDITNVSFRENTTTGDITAIGLDKDNKIVNLGTIKGVGSPKGLPVSDKLSLSDTQAWGLPKILVGQSETQIVSDLQKTSIPSWFNKWINSMESSGRAISPQEAQARWNEFRNKALNESSVKLQTASTLDPELRSAINQSIANGATLPWLYDNYPGVSSQVLQSLYLYQ